MSQAMFSLVESKLWNRGKRRKWQLISGIDKICHVSAGEIFFFSLFVFGGSWVGEGSGKEPVFIYKEINQRRSWMYTMLLLGEFNGLSGKEARKRETSHQR